MKIEKKNVNNDDSKSVTSLNTGSLRKTLKAFLLMIFLKRNPKDVLRLEFKMWLA